MDNSLNDTTSIYSDYGNYGNYTDYSNRFWYTSLYGGRGYGEVAFIHFVLTCLLICLGLPLTFGAIYGLYSLVKNGEVAPIYVINLLISDIIQFCCFIVEVAQPKNTYKYFSEYGEIMDVFYYIYDYSVLASVGFMVCIALERYLVIVHPLWYRCRRTIKTSVLICVLVWILPVVPLLIQCFCDSSVSLVVYTISELLPLPLIIFFLAATLKALYASISVPADEKQRIAGMLILVLLIYLLLFLPGILMLVFWYDFIFNSNADSYPHLERLLDLSPMFLKLSPLADLVLYMILRKGTIRQLLACVSHSRTDGNEINTVTVEMSVD
ncbi:G-protein coupled receptor 4-like [Centropristis striata]|uniref:G-protein coupled receptor 4-like n=1 Tax=Centropristis striata TaxID=184440 RepID=UPI0027DED4E9|nr:G-protein coupled receptor 4-like [Centropristis striata]